ncbi:MAG: energy-dependent translational throttle protein EttA [Phycisphaerales bacterium]|jgi:energy-dependent translational throttle protein EttA|nr:energy-dependent translational throttle protein EttA [Phycisphaerales bacterium]MBT7171482.1 energy-dependent translational throttle protein EttA [Phycisphaerales bacterium]
MAPQFIFSLENVSKSYGDNTILHDLSLSFFYGAKIGIVGENGCGKSTLMKIMAGLDRDIDGDAQLAKNMKVVYVDQEPQLDYDKTVRENLLDSLGETHAKLKRFDEISAEMCEPMDDAAMDKLMNEMGKLQGEIDACDGWEIDRMLDMAADALVLPPDDTLASVLSGGERRRVALCKALLEKPDLLLLDEPTNHLDAETILWLEQTLREYHGTVIIVTHDRYFLDNITKWILEIENGGAIPFEGCYSEWLKFKAEKLRLAEKQESQRQKSLKEEISWLGQTAQGRRSKSKARISSYDELVNQQAHMAKNAHVIQIAPGKRLGEKVLDIQGLAKGYDGETLFEDLNFNLPRGAIVGVVGPNGTGKTTLFRMIVGQETPDAGTVDLGDTVELCYVDQNRDALDDNATIYEEISGGLDEISLGNNTINSRAYVGRFNFKGPLQQKRVGDLSGGERNRVHLAKLLRRGGNFVLLDEPTNDLDVDTIRVLEEAILNFPGCAMVISHDRFFLDRVCTHLLVFEAGKGFRFFEGNFQEYEDLVLKTDAEHLLHRRSKYKRIAMK